MQTPSIHKIIREILLHNNYVVIPGLGGFVTNYQPAIIDPKRQIILPPNKKVSFNANLLDDDGMLVNKLAKQQGVSVKESSLIIKNWVKNAFDTLDDGKRIKIEKLGVLAYNKHLKLEFTPEKSENFNLHTYGMVEVECQPLNKQERLEQDKKRFLNRRVLLRAAALIPFLLVGFLLSYYFSNNSLLDDNKNLSSVIDFNLSESKTLDEEKEVNPVEEIIDHKTDQKNALNYSENKVEKEPTVEDQAKTNIVKEEEQLGAEETKNKDVVTEVKQTSVEKPFWIIAGSFGSKSNANKMAWKLKKKNKPAFVIQSGNNYRVVVNQFATKSEAQKERRLLKSEKISAWIYTNK